MNRVIYRVDDRFIHGQVIEGWINYFKIPNIILANDAIAADPFQRMIYESIMPAGSSLLVTSVEGFKKDEPYKRFTKGALLIIVGSVEDLYKIHGFIEDGSYINIGCLAMGPRAIEVTDTVFMDSGELKTLKSLSGEYDIFVHKLPWDKPVDIRKFAADWEDGS